MWRDDGGAYRPLSTTLMWAIGGWMHGEHERVRQNFQYARQATCDAVRILGKVNWNGGNLGMGFDPRDSGYALGQVIDCAYEEGLKVHLCVTGGGDDPVGAAQAMRPILLPRAEKLLLIESVNEGNASVQDAVLIAEMMKQVGVPTSVGLGDQGLETINKANHQAGCNVGILHEERSADVDRNVRQCWDFRLLEGAPACSEPQGPASSVWEETIAYNLACARFARIVCGAGYWCTHEGHGVSGKTYPYNANTPPGEPHSDTRFANLWEVRDNELIFEAVKNAEAHLPEGCENWAKFNSNQPVVVPANNVNKIYGCIDGGRFCEVVIGGSGPVTLRADQACQLKVVNPATAEVIFEGHLGQGAQTTISGLRTFGLIGSLG